MVISSTRLAREKSPNPATTGVGACADGGMHGRRGPDPFFSDDMDTAGWDRMSHFHFDLCDDKVTTIRSALLPGRGQRLTAAHQGASQWAS
jgi:hypothetical protein